MRDAFVHVNDIGLLPLNDPLQPANAADVELMPQRQADERDAALLATLLQRFVGTADHRDVVAARTKSRRGLEHLVHRAGVELIEFENLKNAQMQLSVVSYQLSRAAHSSQ